MHQAQLLLIQAHDGNYSKHLLPVSNPGFEHVETTCLMRRSNSFSHERIAVHL
jgi:hypothetical protein